MKRLHISRDPLSQYTAHSARNQRQVRAELPRTYQLCSRDVDDALFFDIMESKSSPIKQLMLHLIAVDRAKSHADIAGIAVGYVSEMQDVIAHCRTQTGVAKQQCDHEMAEDEFGLVCCVRCGVYDLVSAAAKDVAEYRRNTIIGQHADYEPSVVRKTCERMEANYSEDLARAAISLADRVTSEDLARAAISLADRVRQS